MWLTQSNSESSDQPVEESFLWHITENRTINRLFLFLETQERGFEVSSV